MRSSYQVINKLINAATPGVVSGLTAGALGGVATTFFYTSGSMLMGDKNAFIRDAFLSNLAGAAAGALVGAGVGFAATRGLTFAGALAKKSFSNQIQILFPALTAIPPAFVAGLVADAVMLETLEKRARARME